MGREFEIKGYEIHMGRSSSTKRIPFMQTGQGLPDGAKSKDERIIGTYFHGLFHNDEFRNALLNSIRKVKQQEEQTEIIRYNDLKEKSFDTLADHVRKHVDLAAIYKEMERYSERRMPV
jgi:adenosylcobyric acid synthase